MYNCFTFLIWLDTCAATLRILQLGQRHTQQEEQKPRDRPGKLFFFMLPTSTRKPALQVSTSTLLVDFSLILCRSISTKRLPLREWDAFQRTFPVTLKGEPPSKRRCVQAGFPNYRAHYHRWRELQLKQRVQHILGKPRARHANGRSASIIYSSNIYE